MRERISGRHTCSKPVLIVVGLVVTAEPALVTGNWRTVGYGPQPRLLVKTPGYFALGSAFSEPQDLSATHCCGFTGTPFTSTTQWRCGPLARPVAPT